MTPDSNADAVEASDTNTTIDTVIEDVQPEVKHKAAPRREVNHTTVPKEALRAAFSSRTIDNVSDEEWGSALAAVAEGKMVLLSGAAPHLRVTQDKFDPGAPLPEGVPSPISILNNIVAGMI